VSQIIIDPNIYTTRPDSSGRLEKEMKVYDLLENLAIPYERIDHAVTPSIESCHEVEEMLHIEICKNLFLCNTQKTNFYLLMMPGNKIFKTAELSKQIQSSRLSFAAAEYMEEFLDITPGSLSVLGLMNDRNNRVKLLIDREVIENEFVGCHPCINTSSLKIKVKDFMEKFLPYVNHEPTIVELSGY
jgi:Ala-tRNA(Pro) deacylase